jgi:hypothetical protein
LMVIGVLRKGSRVDAYGVLHTASSLAWLLSNSSPCAALFIVAQAP